ncbi:MAG: hypothetical protein A2166_04000 [Omnitrophica WOR_2 bacterium RBG_13_41_10]|nr:MAG: hypothetical protein A2166_04000 [Omnitrophica WOR_2 bacterium RBG_13_41_10]
MILNIKVIPKSSKSLVKKENDTLKVYLTKPAQDGLANRQLIELLAKHFGVKKYQISIISGEKSKNKTIRIDA